MTTIQLNNSPYALERLKLVESDPVRFQIQLGHQREMVELVFDRKAFQAERGIDRQENMVALSPDPLGRRLCQGGVGLERLIPADTVLKVNME